jgi:hypothetical protein
MLFVSTSEQEIEGSNLGVGYGIITLYPISFKMAMSEIYVRRCVNMELLSKQLSQHFDVYFLLVIPAVVPVLMCFIKRKLLWISPIIAFMLGILATYIAFPNIFMELITGRDFLGGSWLMVVPIHVMASITITAICYGVCYGVKFIRTRKRHTE